VGELVGVRVKDGIQPQRLHGAPCDCDPTRVAPPIGPAPVGNGGGSMINPMQAGQVARDGWRWRPQRPWKSQDRCSRESSGSSGDALGDGAANWLGSMKNIDGTRVIFDDNFRASAHPGQERRNVGRSGFRFRDADHMLAHKVIIHPRPGCLCLSKRIFE